ncbi:hypothetical protein BDV38DRAFT_283220 [Aspergillus pseudotamarii]|uniref:Uncharacterized protein n=1 Tax=Aspergillus pseudotamarii TaxID=132259 RepID=A0A5N6SQY5_ASPPS|nr:uncharacterized protein BDV38DRAFT_283220 [Aspergillus pseudotamarii]KAE8137106.1 hypothetical protein BDV38DRAFT_283220 [Aspergillus pseudotamarii]
MEEEKRPPLPTRPSQTLKENPTPTTTTTKDPYLNDTSKHQDQDQHDHNEPDSNPSPPAYTPTVLIQNQTTHSAYRPSSILPKPVVIPQTSHSIHGTIYRPFARAYPPALERHGITKTDFLAFIDGLNEVWVANPYIQAISTTSKAAVFVPVLQVQIAALGVAAAAEYGSVKVSQRRTTEYMRVANEELFRPKGLRVHVLKTKVMMAEVGIPGDVLELGECGGRDEEFGDLEDVGKGKGKYDPQLRRVEALREFVCPVVYEEGGGVGKENWITRASDKQESWLAERQNSSIVGKREKAGKLMSEADEAERLIGLKMEEVARAKMAAEERARERMDGPLGESLQGRSMIQDDLAKEMKKLDKQMEKIVREKEKKVTKMKQKGERHLQNVEKKESRIAQKVMWVVVTGDDGSGFQNHLCEELGDA